MEVRLQLTDDGSHTLFVPELGEHYHSVYGALQESQHVFLAAGFEHVRHLKPVIKLLEVGFGTGLNALLTLLQKGSTTIHYTAVEAFPLKADIIAQLNYPALTKVRDAANLFNLLHTVPWEQNLNLTPGFHMIKRKAKIQDIDIGKDEYDLVYYDAFAPEIQPELWTSDIFKMLYDAMDKGGVLVTYSAKGDVKRNLLAAGFFVERLPGPPGKRHMLRATK
jgi:tRNA U34 5-methylaminomethyl-2-thiouridine-forming methyltransferase MnmC